MFKLKKKDIKEKYTNTDIMTIDHLPYIGKIKENLYLATGYNTWGITNSIIAAKIISDLLVNKENEYAKLFNPLRKSLAFFSKIPYYILCQTKSFLGPKLNRRKSWYKNNLKIENKQGHNIAIYIDEKNHKHTVYTTCPHLGCTLIFNEEEKTWDCPCHSSRFDIDGKCIKGPSLKDITYHEK